MHILTFDIEEWFQLLEHPATRSPEQWQGYEERIRGNTDRILQLLSDSGQEATFFVLGWIAETYPDVLRKIEGCGHEVGLHSYNHILAWEQSRNSFRQDTERGIKVIEDITGKKVSIYRAPGFSINESTLWALEILIESGITTDASIFPAARAHGGFRSFPVDRPCLIDFQGYQLKEFPINAGRLAGNRIIFSGGGYFRLWPYSAIRMLTRNSDYVMSYFHPRDFDTAQPMLKGLSYIRKFRSYYGLPTTEEKLLRWLNDFPFTDLRTASASFDWAKATVIYAR